MTATESERIVGASDALEKRARLIAAARGENLESILITYLREYVRGEAA
ncbi:hypothetical protein N1027_01205 [Herbiconiux sp. CPCC 205763]|uniref:Uncharacterized protein n=1 Tax=Herbiconiux aconitum TaxID=2970913 RepID=A0ABT2GKL4_9MICO|nr:hypothetical protein [Herbiconiux aconitum]MCS5716748.1 hypothetical protein [Herbiconiux aconitum]